MKSTPNPESNYVPIYSMLEWIAADERRIIRFAEAIAAAMARAPQTLEGRKPFSRPDDPRGNLQQMPDPRRKENNR